MYYGPYPKIKSFSDGLSLFSQLFIVFSIILFLFYVWGLYISKPIELSSLDKIEGVITEKSVSRYKQGEVYQFRIKTNEGMKLYSVNEGPSSNFCCLSLVPTNVKVIALTDWSWISGLQLYQIIYKEKLVFNAIDSPEEKQKKGTQQLKFSIIFFIISVVIYGFRFIYEKQRKT